MAAWKPWEQEEYKDLYDGGGSSFASTFLKAQEAFDKKRLVDAQAEETLASIEDKKQARTAKGKLAAALSGATPDRYNDAIRDSLASLGDVEGLMNLDQVQRARAEKQAAMENSQLEAVSKLAGLNPDLAATIWNNSPLSQKYGKRSPDELYKPEVKAGAGALYTVGPDGEVDIKYKQERRTGSGSGKSSSPGLKSVYDPEKKQNVYINPKDPEAYARMLAGEYLPPKTGNSGGSDWDSLLGEKAEEEPVQSGGPKRIPVPQGTVKTRRILKLGLPTGLGGFGG